MSQFGSIVGILYAQPLKWFLAASLLLNVFLASAYWRTLVRYRRMCASAQAANRESTATEQRAFWPLILSLIAAGVVLVATKNEFLISLGHAALIAGVLAGTVDLYLKQRLLKEILLDASKFLIGYELPTEVKDRIRELILTPLIRRDFELRCELTELADGCYRSVLEWSFEIDNLSHKPQTYQQSAESLENSKEEQPKFLEFRCDSTEPGASYVVPGDDPEPRSRQKR